MMVSVRQTEVTEKTWCLHKKLHFVRWMVRHGKQVFNKIGWANFSSWGFVVFVAVKFTLTSPLQSFLIIYQEISKGIVTQFALLGASANADIREQRIPISIYLFFFAVNPQMWLSNTWQRRNRGRISYNSTINFVVFN